MWFVTSNVIDMGDFISNLGFDATLHCTGYLGIKQALRGLLP